MNAFTTRQSIAAGTLSDGQNALSITATMPSTITATNSGVNITVASAGSSSFSQRAMAITLNAGYTGNIGSNALATINSAASTGGSIANGLGNFGISARSDGTTTGWNIGNFGVALNGNISIGVSGRATTAKNSATNIGGAFIGNNSGTSPIQIGVYAGLNTSDPTFASAALLVDNASTTSPIAIFRDNGSAVFTINDGGLTSLTPATLSDGQNALSITATMPTTMTVANNAINISVTSAGSSSLSNRAMQLTYAAGYTGSSNTVGVAITNNAAGTAGNILGNLGNFGFIATTSSTTTGYNVGGRYLASGGNKNIGAVGSCITAKNSATNIGGAFFGRNTGTSPTQIGVYAGLNSSDPTFTSAALLVDNAAETSPIAIFRDNGTAVFTINDGGLTSIAPFTLSDGQNALSITATMPSSASAINNAINITITGSGSASQANRALNISYNAGYTGSSNTVGLASNNYNAGTGAIILNTPAGNYGLNSSAQGTTTGNNVGGQYSALNGNKNLAVVGVATTAKNSATNIGGAFFGNNSGTSPIQIGVYAGLNTTDPTFVSAALIADNASATDPIALFRDNGTTVWSIADGGALTAADGSNIVGGTSTGMKLMTATNQKFAAWNATPIVQPVNTTAIDTLLTNIGFRASGGVANFDTDLKLQTAGSGLYVKEGSNATMGTATLSSGTVTVSTTKVTASSRIFLTRQSLGTITTPVDVSVTAVSAGTSFTITSADNTDTSVIAWIIIEPS